MRWEKLQNMVLGAKELPQQDQHPYLKAASKGDQTLFEEAKVILRSYEADNNFLSTPIGSVDALLESRRKKVSWFQKLFGG